MYTWVNSAEAEASELGMWMFPELSLWGFFSEERTEEKTKAILESS